MKTLRISSTILSVALLLSASGAFAMQPENKTPEDKTTENKTPETPENKTPENKTSIWQRTKDVTWKVVGPYKELKKEEIDTLAGERTKKIDENIASIIDLHDSNALHDQWKKDCKNGVSTAEPKRPERKLTFKENVKFQVAKGVTKYTEFTHQHPTVSNTIYYPTVLAAVSCAAYGSYKLFQWAKNKFWNKKEEQKEQKEQKDETSNEDKPAKEDAKAEPKKEAKPEVTGLTKEQANVVKQMATDIYEGKTKDYLANSLLNNKTNGFLGLFKKRFDEVASAALISSVEDFDMAMTGAQGGTQDEMKSHKDFAYNSLVAFLDGYSK